MGTFFFRGAAVCEGSVTWQRFSRLSSAHLLACGARWQDVELGQLGRVLLGLEPEGGDAGGATVGGVGR